MKYLNDIEFKRKMYKIEVRNKRKQQRDELNAAKEYIPKIKLPSTSKIALWAVIVICVQIVWFCEKMVLLTYDTSALTPLVGAVPSVVVALLGYYNKSSKENTSGGIVYDMAFLNRKEELLIPAENAEEPKG